MLPPRDRPEVALRVVALVSAAALLAAAAVAVTLVLFSALLASKVPDPFVPNGDPCCGHPDSWAEIYESAALGIAVMALSALTIVVVLALAGWSIRGRGFVSRRPLVVAPVLGAALATLAFAAAIAPNLGQGRTAPACDTFVFRPTEWRSPDEEVRRRTMLGLHACEQLIGRTRAEVRSLLGAPRSPNESRTLPGWSYGGLSVSFSDEQVTQTEVGYDA